MFKALRLEEIYEKMVSSEEYKTGGWRTFKPVFDKEKCIDCGSCWIYCPENSIIKKGKADYDVDLEFCKGCGICANECPTEAIKMVLEEK